MVRPCEYPRNNFCNRLQFRRSEICGFPKIRFGFLTFAPFTLLAIALAYQGAEETRLLARLREWPNRIPFHVAKVMRAGIPAGARVFTCEWGLTGNLMLALPDRRFLVALDPTLFQAKDPDLYKLWYTMTRRPPPEVAQMVRERFGARYVACFFDEQFREFNERLASEPGVRTLLVSDDWNVYDLGDTPTEEKQVKYQVAATIPVRYGDACQAMAIS